MRYDREGLIRLLREAREAHATDIHLKAPSRPRFRIVGDLVQTPYPALQPEDTLRLAQGILDLAGRELPLASVKDLRVGFGLHREGRFRAHIYRQRGSMGLVIHRMALQPPSLAELGAPAGLADDVWGRPGLYLVTGRMDRVRLIAGLVDAYNQTRPGSLLTVEQPLEYLHKDARAMVSQREVGVDVETITDGLYNALCSDSDGVVTTDLPDMEAAEMALRLAESGRVVLAGLAGTPWEEAARVFSRRFPPHREQEVRERLERCLAGALSLEGAQTRFHTPEALAG